MSLDYGVIQVFMAYMYTIFTFYVEMDTAPLFFLSERGSTKFVFALVAYKLTSVVSLGYFWSGEIIFILLLL